jgi:hypothetical protein
MDAPEAVKLLGDAIVDTVADMHPDFCPAGPMYMGFMQAGGNYSLFMAMLSRLEREGRLKKIMAHCYVLSDAELFKRGLTREACGHA